MYCFFPTGCYLIAPKRSRGGGLALVMTTKQEKWFGALKHLPGGSPAILRG
jgi:hypothetical protein